MHNQSNGIFIPKDLWDISGLRAYLQQIIEAFYFSYEIPKNVWTVLEKHGFAEKRFKTPIEITNLLQKKCGQVVDDVKFLDLKSCQWCHAETYILHQQYFPLESYKGGKETVSICPSCRDEYKLFANSYTFTDKFLSLFSSSLENNKLLISSKI